MAVFVDTGAWFAYFVRRDPDHRDHLPDVCRRADQPLPAADLGAEDDHDGPHDL